MVAYLRADRLRAPIRNESETMKNKLDRPAALLVALFAAVSLSLAGCSSSPSTEADGNKPAAQEAAPKPEAPAELISLAEVADSGHEGAAKACTALLESPAAVTEKLGLSSDEVPPNQGTEITQPWRKASTGNFGEAANQRTLSCEFRGYLDSGQVYVIFGLMSPEGESPFCLGDSPCVISDDKERYIEVTDQTDDPKSSDINIDVLKDLLDRFTK